MTVAGARHKHLFTSQALSLTSGMEIWPGFLAGNATPHGISGSEPKGKAAVSGWKVDMQPTRATFCESRLNAHAVAAHMSPFGINLNCLPGLRETKRYGMFTQWVRSNLMAPC
jgi:hypothetical protein